MFKTNYYAFLPADKAIEQLKAECTPKSSIAQKRADRCEALCPANVLDDCGDSCEGYRCLLTKGHESRHMSSDGANGYVYF